MDSHGEVLARNSEESKLDGIYLPILNGLLVKQSEAKEGQLVKEF